MHLGRKASDLAPHDQVNVEIESVRLQRFTMSFLDFTHFRSHVVDRVIERLPGRYLFASRLGFSEMQILVDQRDSRLSQGQIAGAKDADHAFARLLVDPHLRAAGDVIHTRTRS